MTEGDAAKVIDVSIGHKVIFSSPTMSSHRLWQSLKEDCLYWIACVGKQMTSSNLQMRTSIALERLFSLRFVERHEFQLA